MLFYLQRQETQQIHRTTFQILISIKKSSTLKYVEVEWSLIDRDAFKVQFRKI